MTFPRSVGNCRRRRRRDLCTEHVRGPCACARARAALSLAADRDVEVVEGAGHVPPAGRQHQHFSGMLHATLDSRALRARRGGAGIGEGATR